MLYSKSKHTHYFFEAVELFEMQASDQMTVILNRGCQIDMQGPQLCAGPRHFYKLDVPSSRIAFLDLKLLVLQLGTSNSNN